MKCNNCGNEIVENSAFCTFCGSPVSPTEPTEAPTSAVIITTRQTGGLHKG